MAGAQRGKPNGNFVRMTLSNGEPVFFLVCQSSTGGLGYCAECGYIPEEVYRLPCYHILCKQCFCASTEYVCKTHKQKTKIKPGVEHTYALNMGLLKIFLQCPLCCQLHRYNDMKIHIQTVHGECFERKAEQFPLKKQDSKPHVSALVRQDYASVARGGCESVPPVSQNIMGQSEAAPKKGEQEWRGQQAQLTKAITKVVHKGGVSFSPQSEDSGREKMEDQYADMMTDDESSDASLGGSLEEPGIEREASEDIVTCRHCITPCAVSEIKEHEDNCPDRKVKCHTCKEVITAKHYDEHMEIHYRKAQMTSKGAEEGLSGDVMSMSDAKKYVQKVLREQKQSWGNTSMSTDDTEECIAKFKRNLKERNERNSHRSEPSAAIHTATAKPKIENQGTRETEREDKSPTMPTPGLEGKVGPDSTGTIKKNIPPEAAMPNAETQDKEEELEKRKEVIELKNKIKELEHRLQNLERPLEALIKRLSEEHQQKRRLQSSTDL